MRILPPLTALALLLLAAPADAQEDACSQSEPCPWVVDVDATGILDGDLDATLGDWYYLDVTNLDGVAHTLTLEGHDVVLQVPADGSATSDPIQLDTTGTFSLADQPSGGEAWLVVRATDVVDDQEGGDGDGADADDDARNDTPLPVAVTLAAVGAALLLRRR